MDTNGTTMSLRGKFFKQFGELFRSFFIYPKDENGEIVKPTRECVKAGVKGCMYGFVQSIITTVFAFMLKMTNTAISNSLFLLGIILYILYEAQPVLNDFKTRYEIKLKAEYGLSQDNSLCLKGGKIVAIVSGKVRKYYKDLGVFKTMTNEEIMYSIKKYMQAYWSLLINYWFDLLSGVIAIVTAIVAVATNNAVDNLVLILAVSIATVLAFIMSAYRSFFRNDFNKNIRTTANKQSLINGDLMRVPFIVKSDLQMRVGKLEEYVKANNKLNLDYSKGKNMTDILMSVVHSGLNIFFIISYVSKVGLSNITLSDITQISATLAILHTVMRKVTNLPSLMESRHNCYSDFIVEKEDFGEIIRVYNEVINSQKSIKPIRKIVLNPFRIKYKEESCNDKPFTLVSNSNLTFSLGDIVLLSGPSGSGKSTFINLITDRISLEKSDDIPSTSRALIYDEKMRFGSLTIFEELFCCDSNPDLEKMKYILDNLHLWQELQASCVDVWQWMKEKSFIASLSNGQKQRLIIAKMLYFSDSDIDVLALDECTSGLDVSDAEAVLSFITNYVSKDRKRIIFISTHQNLDKYISAMKKTHTVHELRFERDGEENIVKPV